MPSKIIFFDTETTGTSERDFLCQLAYKRGIETFSSLYKPPVKIPPEASAIHHISQKMVEDRSLFRESPEYERLKQMFEDEDAVVVAHNASFDLMMIGKEGIHPKNSICTLRVARHLDPEEKLGQYKLQYLRYVLGIEIDATAHDALGDVLVLEKLFERLKEKASMEEMMEISSKPCLLRRFNFGKYKGMKIEEADREYLEWLLGEKEKNSQGEEDWIYTLRYHLWK